MQIQRNATVSYINRDKNIPPVHNKQWQRKESIHIRREKSRKCLLIRRFVKRKIFSLNGEIVSRSWWKEIIHHMTYFLMTWLLCVFTVPPSIHRHTVCFISSRDLKQIYRINCPKTLAMNLLVRYRACSVRSNSGNFSFTTPLTILFQVVYLPSYVLSRIVGNLCVLLCVWCETLPFENHS